MKYIATKQEDGTEEIFIFPMDVNHDCMAEVLSGIRNQTWGDWKRIRRNPISAGFIEGGQCVGGSETLQLKARPEDTSLLKA